MNDTGTKVHSLSDFLDGESEKSLIRSLATMVLLVFSFTIPTGLTIAHHVHSTEDHQVIELEVFDQETPPSLEMVSSVAELAPKVTQKILRNPITPSSKTLKQSDTSEETPAKVIEQVLPRIPDSLRGYAFRSYVRVSVSIGKDGVSKVLLRESSGKEEVDAIVMQALSKWKWSPAEKFGKPIDSERNFKFIFEVR